MRRRAALAACLLLAAPGAWAQRALSGRVTDARTGETLAGASVALLGPDGAVVGGTATNADGRFALRLATLPADLAVRYLGYETGRLRVTAATPDGVTVALAPDVAEIGTLTVTPGEAPAEALLRRVVARVRAQRAAVGPYAVTAYGRTTLVTPSGEIRGILEGLSDAYWAPASGWREAVTATRRTGNLGPGGGGATAIADGLVDLLAADVELAGHRLMGPTHADALSAYRAEIAGTTVLDGRLVVTLAVRPRRATASAFEGTLDVLFDTADVLAADLRPGPAFAFPPPVRVQGARFRQQYVPVAPDSSLWLPADLRSEVGIGFGLDGLLAADPFRIERVAQLSGYRLGVTAPDSLLAGAPVQRAAAPDSTRLRAPGVAPTLSRAEADAYAEGDSLGALNDLLVFRGPLAALARRGITVSAGGAPDSAAAPRRFAFSFAPRLAVNPAERVRAGLGAVLRAGPLRLAPSAALRLRDRRVSLGADASLRLARLGAARVSLAAALADDVARRSSLSAPPLATGLAGGRGGYYRSRRASGGIDVAVPEIGTVRTGSFFQFDTEAEASVRFVAERVRAYEPGATDADLLGLGPAGRSVTLRSLRLDAAVGTLDEPLGLLPQRRARGMAEWAPSGWGDAAFWRAEAVVDGRVATFARRRAVPPALDVRLAAGVGRGVGGGAVPLARQFAAEHALGASDVFGGASGVPDPGLTAFGALRSRTDVPHAGDRYALAAWEHSFQTIPFEAVGLGALARRQYNLILHGAHARTWGGPLAATAWHHEVGVSLSGLFGVLRLDLTQRLDAPGTVVGVSVARPF